MINSMFKAGQKLDVSDCTFNGKYNRQNSSVQYILEGLFDLQCKNKRLMSHDLSIRIAGVRSDAPSTVLKLSTASDIYYPQSSIQIEHQKFTRQNGLIKVLVRCWNIQILIRVSLSHLNRKLLISLCKLILICR